MFRLLINIVVVISLLFTTTGMLVSKHYCHGELVSISYGSQAESCCKSGTCCNTETEFHQLKENFIYSTIIENVDYFQNIIEFECFFNEKIFSIDFVKFTDIFSGSPPTFNLHTFLSKIQNFRL